MKYKQIALVVLFPLLIAGMQSGAKWVDMTDTEYDTVIERAGSFLDGKPAFRVDISVSSFRTHHAEVPYETQTGFLVKSGNYFHSCLLGIHTYQNKKYMFTVDTVNKRILIADALTEKDYKPYFDNYEALRSYMQGAKKMELTSSDRVKVAFDPRMRVSHIVMELTKEGFINKSTSFISREIPEKPDDPNSSTVKPRLETTFTNYRKNIKVDYEKEFGEAQFFTLSGKNFVGVGNYKAYRIKDTRVMSSQ